MARTITTEQPKPELVYYYVEGEGSASDLFEYFLEQYPQLADKPLAYNQTQSSPRKIRIWRQ